MSGRVENVIGLMHHVSGFPCLLRLAPDKISTAANHASPSVKTPSILSRVWGYAIAEIHHLFLEDSCHNQSVSNMTRCELTTVNLFAAPSNDMRDLRAHGLSVVSAASWEPETDAVSLGIS